MNTMYASLRTIHSYLPEKLLSNQDLAKEFPDWKTENIYEKTGIATRAISGKDECASDLAFAACTKLFASGLIKRSEIDFLLLCTQSPDYFLPTTACILQDRLGLPTHCGALDFNLGCSGYVYGLSIAKGLIASGSAKNVLLVTSETYSKFINKSDRSVRTIFGDGAAASLISISDDPKDSIGPFVFGTDGRGAENLMVPAGGMRLPHSLATSLEKESAGSKRSQDNLFMDGPKILTFTLRTVPALVRQLLQKSGQSIDSIDYFVFHQANKFMLNRLAEKIEIPREKFCINMEDYGNTVSATIPMALEKAAKDNHLKAGAKVMLIGFGVGYSWAGSIINLGAAPLFNKKGVSNG